VAAVNFTAGDWSGTATATPLAVVFSSIQANWTGTGSSSNKLTPPQTGNTSGWPGAFQNASFIAGVSGTLRITAISAGLEEGRRILINGVIVYDPTYQTTSSELSFSIAAGNTIDFAGDYGGIWNKGTRVWIE
jgi:hypothetical protein